MSDAPAPPQTPRSLATTWTETLRLDWTEFRPIEALYCLPAILGLLVLGLLIGQQFPALVASTGALTVGFGAFQRMFRDPRTPMIAVAIGTSVSAAIGTLANAWLPAELFCAALWGTGIGLMKLVHPGFGWLAMQGGIALVIAASFPATPEYALLRLLLVLAGAAVQFATIITLRRLAPGPFPISDDPSTGSRTVSGVLREAADILLGGAPGRAFALTSGAAVMAAELIARSLPFPNGYWVPLTVMLLLTPDARETTTRAFARIAGTILGAGILTLLMAALRPSQWWTVPLIGVAVWSCYALQRVNYAALSFCITAYVVLLFGLAGLPEPQVALDRALATALGGIIALLTHAACRAIGRRS
jgi:hypothetical protein